MERERKDLLKTKITLLIATKIAQHMEILKHDMDEFKTLVEELEKMEPNSEESIVTRAFLDWDMKFISALKEVYKEFSEPVQKVVEEEQAARETVELIKAKYFSDNINLN